MKYFITGASGFIGSNFTDRFLNDGHEVVGYDNLSTGQEQFLKSALKNKNFKFIKGDLLEKDKLTKSMKSCDVVIHFAANADIKDGLNHPFRDLEQNTIATFNVLESMRFNNINKIAFSSTGSVYGDCDVIPTPENAPFPIQTSLYATSKLSGEGLIQSYCEGYGFQSWIFRFVSILGERYSHGHVFDFYKQLLKDPNNLVVLGDGKQKKSYLYVGDCIEAVIHAMNHSKNKINIFNLGTDEYVKVKDSIKYICRFLKLDPKLSFTGGERGWVGDNPFIFFFFSKIKRLGWKPKLTIEEGVVKTISYLKDNNWLFNNRN